MSKIRTVQRVSEEYILDPATGLYYWLAPIYKKGTDQQLLDDMNAMVKFLRAYDDQPGEHVFRPTAMIQQSAMGKIGAAVQDTLAKNTYLMLFEYGAIPGDIIPDGTISGEWVSEGNNIFLWSDDDTVYTWCTPDNLAHRFPRVTKEEALREAFTKPNQDEINDQLDEIYSGYLQTLLKTISITGTVDGHWVNLKVEVK